VNSGSSGRKPTPLGQGVRAVQLEGIAAVEMTVLVEVIVDRGGSGIELLQGLDIPEARHRSFSPSERLVRIFGSIVEPPTAHLPVREAKEPCREAQADFPCH
jgi:hypothetical protein